MQKLATSILALMLLCLSAVSAHAGSVTLAWDASPGVAGYRVSIGNQSGVYVTTVDAGNALNVKVNGLVVGSTYYFVVRAVSSGGALSAPSNEVSYRVPVVTQVGRLTYDSDTGDWSDAPVDWNGNSPVASPGWNVQTGDFNGDGVMDLFFYNPSNGAWKKATDNRDGTYTFFGYNWAAGWTPLVADFNGDGRSDVFLYNKTNGKWFRCLTIGTGDFGYLAGTWAAGWQLTPADFNGDNRTDLFLYNTVAHPHPNSGLWFRVLTDAAGNFSYVQGEMKWASDWTFTPADLNGDGRDELFLYRNNGQWFKVYFDAAGTRYVGGTWAGGWTINAADFNADGRSELFLYNPTTGKWFVVSNNRGDAFEYRDGLWGANWKVSTTDFNRDNRTDLLLYNELVGQWFEVTTQSSGAFTYILGTGPVGTDLKILR